MAKITDTTEDDEFEIPDSDDTDEEDVPDEDELDDDEPDFDAPHDHPHTAGYPAHAHQGDQQVAYQADETFASGGTELFTPERHDNDSRQAAEAEAEQARDTDLRPLADEYETLAQALGWETDRNEHPAGQGGIILGLSRSGRDVSVTIAYTE